MPLLDAPGFEETPLELLDWVSLNGQTCTPIYGLRTFCGEGSVNLYWALVIFLVEF